jgi:hypothetical protein
MPGRASTSQIVSTAVTTPTGPSAVGVDRLGLLLGLGEHRDDHAEDDGGGQRAADALSNLRNAGGAP